MLRNLCIIGLHTWRLMRHYSTNGTRLKIDKCKTNVPPYC